VTFETCSACGAPSYGSYRCPACTTAAEGAARGLVDFSLASRTQQASGSESLVKQVFFWPGAVVTGLNRAADRRLIPSWLPKALGVFLVGWLVFLFIWGFAA